MTDQKLYRLVQKLNSLTKESKLDWNEDFEDGSFAVNFPNQTLTISHDHSGGRNNAEIYVVTIRNDEGKVIERVSDEDLDGHESEEVPHFVMMKDIYEGARRHASGASAAIDEILEQLGDDDSIPF